MATSSGKCKSFCRFSNSEEYTVHCSISGRNAIRLRSKSTIKIEKLDHNLLIYNTNNTNLFGISAVHLTERQG